MHKFSCYAIITFISSTNHDPPSSIHKSTSLQTIQLNSEMIQSSLSSLTSNPVFSSIITLYTLVLLYFPSSFLSIISSPVLLFTFILLLYLLRLGASQNPALTDSYSTKPILEYLNSNEIIAAESDSAAETTYQDLSYVGGTVALELDSGESISIKFDSPEPNSNDLKFPENISADFNFTENGVHDSRDGTRIKFEDDQGVGFGLESSKSECFDSDTFVEWDVRAPLEVIYEGEEEGESRETQMAVIEKYASLSMYYPETDTDSSSSEMDFPVSGSPENGDFRWEEEDDFEGLIEIELDGKVMVENEVEEDNLIEIDLSPTR